MKLSCIIITKNEEKNIRRALNSINFCNEIIIIDDNSTDKTKDLARKIGAKVYSRKLDSFCKQRNYGLKKAQGEWVLFIDADETISPELKKEIEKTTNNANSNTNGFFVKRKDIIWNQKLNFGETGSIKLLRLAKKNSGIWKRRVHEYWNVQGMIGILNNPILHYAHANIQKFLFNINRFSTLHAKSNRDEKKSSNLFKIVTFPIFKFLQNYFLRLGFLDGLPGFVHAMLMSFHSYLAWSKLWLIQKKN